MTAFGLAVRWLHLACGLGLVGLVTALLLAGRSDRPTALAWEARMLRWARGLAGLLLVSGLGALAYQTAVVTGRAGAALEPVAWAQLLTRSQFGTVWLVRHGYADELLDGADAPDRWIDDFDRLELPDAERVTIASAY